MKVEILSVIILGIALSYALSFYHSSFYAATVLFFILLLIAVRDVLQKKRAIVSNYPILGHFRYLLESVRPEIQQYFIESDTEGKPIPRVYRSVIYQRAKRQLDTVAFGTQLDVYAENYEWIRHATYPTQIDIASLRTTIGSSQCTQPYSSSLFNISAMSYGALSKTAVSALNKGAKLGGFYHNTGEGGISPYHLHGGDLVWQVGTGYFGCRDKSGNFSPELFQKNASLEAVKMIELKLSQGAKPGHGGILPGSKVNAEVAAIRNVEIGKTVHSPARHSAFGNHQELLRFITQLRDLSGGKPVGIKICIGKTEDFVSLCQAMVDNGIFIDFISIDGGEGGTGAAPIELTNNVGCPLEDGLTAVDNILRSFGLRQEIKIIAAGKAFTAFHIFKRLALGADVVSSARGMMLALGCIQALRCNTNHCPSGVATSLPRYYKGIDVEDKTHRVANYHERTMLAFKELVEVAGYNSPEEIKRSSIAVRKADRQVATLEDIFPSYKN